MKGCSRWDAIIDCALGQMPEPDLAAHLEIWSAVSKRVARETGDGGPDG
jgi:hypothetical protein